VTEPDRFSWHKAEATRRRLNVAATPSSPTARREPFGAGKNATGASRLPAGDEASPPPWPAPNRIVPAEGSTRLRLLGSGCRFAVEMFRFYALNP